MYLNPGARCTLQNTMLSVRGLEVQIKFWRACFRDSGPFDQYIKSQQDMKGKMGVHHFMRACHTIKPYLQDDILKAEKKIKRCKSYVNRITLSLWDSRNVAWAMQHSRDVISLR